MTHSSEEVLSRIDKINANIIVELSQLQIPTLQPHSANESEFSSHSHKCKHFANLSQSRGFTNSVLILSFVQKLLKSKRTTTNREVYYFFITHFRNQRECDSAISDVCSLLSVQRISLGLTASPKGWFCGCFEITRPNSTFSEDECDVEGQCTTISGTALSSIQGLPITREWIHRAALLPYHSDNEFDNNEYCQRHREGNFTVKSNATCIIVVEKEGVYTRLSEDRFYDDVPCIIVTGKGFPDVATRALVHTLHHLLEIPVYGLADCNPFGVAVLRTYCRGGKGIDGGERYSVPIQWLGLRPSQLVFGNDSNNGSSHDFEETHQCRDSMDMKVETGTETRLHPNSPLSALPNEVFQNLTDLDKRKIETLCKETDPFVNSSIKEYGDAEARKGELRMMLDNGWKVELESLHWLGMDFMSKWLGGLLRANLKRIACVRDSDDDSASGSCDESIDQNGQECDYDTRIAI